MISKMISSYDLLLDLLNTTSKLIKEVRYYRLESTNIKVQISVLNDMIKAFERLKKDLIAIDNEFKLGKD